MKQQCEHGQPNEVATSQSDAGYRMEVEVQARKDGDGSSPSMGMTRRWLDGSRGVVMVCQDRSDVKRGLVFEQVHKPRV